MLVYVIVQVCTGNILITVGTRCDFFNLEQQQKQLTRVHTITSDLEFSAPRSPQSHP